MRSVTNQWHGCSRDQVRSSSDWKHVCGKRKRPTDR
uniref:Uncharacterized protein n=1 Tax=Ciona intestinalis TaxID=7719 RepID=H2Y1D1_CIOIN